MEGHRFDDGSGFPEASKQEEAESLERSPAEELSVQAETVSDSIDAARRDAENAMRMLADIKDSAAHERFSRILGRLRGRMDGFGDPKKIALALIEKLGADAFEKRKTPPGELN